MKQNFAMIIIKNRSGNIEKPQTHTGRWQPHCKIAIVSFFFKFRMRVIFKRIFFVYCLL